MRRKYTAKMTVVVVVVGLFLLFVWKKLLIYNDVLVSGIQESDSDHFRFLSIIDYYDIEYSSLCYTVDPCWVSVLYIVVSIF